MIVIVSKPGYLANDLHLFAHFIALSRETGIRISNPSFNDSADFFPATENDVFCRYPLQRSSLAPSKTRRDLMFQAWRYVGAAARRLRLPYPVRVARIDWDEECNLDSREFLELADSSPILIVQGWKFRTSSVARHADFIRKTFTPLESIDSLAATPVARLRQHADIVIGVHIRQGDYALFQGGRYFYDTQAYLSFLRHAESLFPDRSVAFVICSNVEHDPSVFSDHVCGFGPGTPIADLYALSKCDYLIGPPSTFTMWASFFGEIPLYRVFDPNRHFTLSDYAICETGD